MDNKIYTRESIARDISDSRLLTSSECDGRWLYAADSVRRGRACAQRGSTLASEAWYLQREQSNGHFW